MERITQWILDGPILYKPIVDLQPLAVAPVTYPNGLPAPTTDTTVPPSASAQLNDLPEPLETSPTLSPTNPDPHDTTATTPTGAVRRSQRKRKAPDRLQPKFKGKVYNAAVTTSLTRKQRVPAVWVYIGKERVSPWAVKIRRLMNMKDKSDEDKHAFQRFKDTQWQQRRKRIG